MTLTTHIQGEQREESIQLPLHQELEATNDQPPSVDYDKYFGRDHCPASPCPSAREIELFNSRRDFRHRRQVSRDRSMWLRTTRRIMGGAEVANSPGPKVKEDPVRVMEPSRKHSSLMEGTHQYQNPQRRHQTWYYSSNHVLVNQKRIAHGLPALMRCSDLDGKARQVAEWAAAGNDLQDMLPDEGAASFTSGNVLVGKSIRDIHRQTLVRKTCQRELNNLLNPDFTVFGMGTYKDNDSGLLYMCQLFGTGMEISASP